MPDEVGTETTRSDAPSVDDSLFGDATAAADKPVAAVEEEDSTDQTKQGGQGSDDAGVQDAKADAAEEEPTADDAGEDTGSSDDLKIVVSIKAGKAIIGVQKPSADPHIETFDDGDLVSLAQEVPAVSERAKARWEETLKHPAYERPAPSARRRNRRQQGAAQTGTAEAEAGTEQQTSQQALKLF